MPNLPTSAKSRDPKLVVLLNGADRGLQPIKHRAFLEALRTHFPALEVWSIEPDKFVRYYWLARCFTPQIDRWRNLFHNHPGTFGARSAAFARKVRRHEKPVDVFLQVGAMFAAPAGADGRPVVIYTDYATTLTAQRGRDFRLNLPERLVRKRIGQERDTLSGAQHICTRSELVARAVVDYGISTQNVTVVGGGANTIAAPAKHDDAVHLLFVGGEFTRKGGDIVLDAFAQVCDKYPGARLHMVTSPLHQRPKQGVVWHTDADDVNLAKLYAQAHIFVMASRFETWGDVVIEAMTAGCAVVVPKFEPLTEIVTHDVDGVHVAPENPDALAVALDQLLSAPDRCAELGEAARQTARARFTWPIVAEKLAQAIHKVAGSDGFNTQ